jgi:signal transduction histidine kinase
VPAPAPAPAPPLARFSRARLLVLLLLMTAGLASVLTYEAYDAARSHRATTERVLTDYATFAAWRVLEAGKAELYAMTARALAPVMTADVSGARAPGPEVIAPAAKHAAPSCDGAPDTLRYYFRADLGRGTTTFAGHEPPPWVVATLADSIRSRRYWESMEDINIIPFFRELPGERRMLVYAIRHDTLHHRKLAYGFEACLGAFIGPRFDRVMARHSLVPSVLTKGIPNESLLSVVVRDSYGRVVYRSSPQYPAVYVGEAPSTGRAFLGSTVALRPDAAGRLVIGGLPRSRLSVLLGILALTMGLVAVALLQLRREHELARLRADFVSGVSHELRTPLAQIRMFGETLRLGRVRSEGERQRSLEIIDQEARRLTHLVENVLHFSRAERQRTHLSREPTDLGRQVAEAVELFAPIAQSRRVTLVAELTDGVVAPVDRDALRQVLLNLLDNAVKYGPPGQTVTVRLTRHGDRARVAVEDQGPGITPRERVRIWEPFYRLERDAGSAVAGSGIGLSVVRELVRQHGGRVWVESAPAGDGRGDGAGGARFVLELPGVEDPAAAPAGAPQSAAPQSAAPQSGAPATDAASR